MQGPLSIRTLTSSTTPKFAASVTSQADQAPPKKGFFKELLTSPAGVPIAMIGGMVLAAVILGVHSVKQQFFHSPSVQVTKTKRECMPEVDYPDAVIKSADKFQNKSFLRKIGHIQDKEYTNYTQVNPFSRYVLSTCRI